MTSPHESPHRGRPKKPNAPSASDRVRAARAAKIAAGGALRQFMLSAEAVAALAAIRARDVDGSDKAVIERLLIKAADVRSRFEAADRQCVRHGANPIRRRKSTPLTSAAMHWRAV